MTGRRIVLDREAQRSVEWVAGSSGLADVTVRGWLSRPMWAALEARDRADALVSALVAQAREDGMTWEQIGDLLGVSRQAAHKRYGHAAPAVAGDLPPALPGL